MAQKKITDLQLRSAFDGTCNVPVDDASQTWRTTGEQLRDYVRADLPGASGGLESGTDGVLSISALGVTTAMLAALSVTEGKIGAEAVSLSKLAAAVAAALCPTGATLDFVGTTAPTGWLLCSGGTIGSASSGGTLRANADTETLYALLWDSWSNTELPIQTSGGVASTRGANAAADFAANKRLPVPDVRGRVIAGKDDMGGSAASRLTSSYFGIGTTLGLAGGSQSHTLTTSQMPAHTHDAQVHDGGGGAYDRALRSQGNAIANLDGIVQSAGGGQGHNNTQPTIVMNKIIKL